MTRCLTAATLAASILAALYVGLWMAARRGEADVFGDWDPDYMCPNCVTPWKCNGPHIPEPDPYLVTGI